MSKKDLLMMLAGCALSFPAMAAETTVTLYSASEQGIGTTIGTVIISETPYGLLFKPSLKGLSTGIHGFHIHENPNCNPGKSKGKTVPAGAAGDHLDPNKTGTHLGPYAEGHLGDLPGLVVNASGVADYPVLAPRLKSLKTITGHSLMIHQGGDNYSSKPAPAGGGGPRLFCGVIHQ